MDLTAEKKKKKKTKTKSLFLLPAPNNLHQRLANVFEFSVQMESQNTTLNLTSMVKFEQLVFQMKDHSYCISGNFTD